MGLASGNLDGALGQAVPESVDHGAGAGQGQGPSSGRGQLSLDDADDFGGVRLRARPEPADYRAIACHDELLEVPLDVAGLAIRVGDRGELGVERMPARPVDLD